jgi:hypothetical protein
MAVETRIILQAYRMTLAAKQAVVEMADLVVQAAV